MASLFLAPLYLALTIEVIREEEANFLSVITIHQGKVGDAINTSFSSVSYGGQYMGVSLDH